jgi:hypothetical protein
MEKIQEKLFQNWEWIQMFSELTDFMAFNR